MPAITAFLFFATIGILAVVGWVMNIVKIIGALGDPTITPLFIARIVGAFAAPIGAVLGYF